MIAAERVGDRGGRIDAELLRAFILTALDHDAARDAVDDLLVAGRLTEVPGKRRATGYLAVPLPHHAED